MNIIETEKLSRRFGHVTALNEVDLSVPNGSIYALLGPNGAGKTTLLETLLNLWPPTAGVARVLGCDSRQLGPGQLAHIGYVSENQLVDDRLKVAGFLTFARGLYPTWDSQLEQKLIHDFEVPLEYRFKELSRGMRIRALFIAALSFRPRLLILDEPFGGLDPLMRDELAAKVLDLAQEDGGTILLASHDVDEVERMADRVAFLESGRIRLADSIESVCGRHVKVVARLAKATAPAVAKRESWLGFRQEGEIVSFVTTQSVRAESVDWEQELGAAASITTAPLSLKEIYLTHARIAQAERNES
ncbi:MAG: ABC transporter ATP-binding protein [Dechloromonas sp.]|nr:MAG: ABC transporter ATP-binding protein [Dechloromonas sp.]